MIEVISLFSFDTSRKPLEEWERYYAAEYVPKLRSLPGLNRYIVGKTMPAPGALTDFARVAVLYFDDLNGFAQAFATPLGQEMLKRMNEMAPRSKLYVVDAAEVPS
jgi:uncharacterized protein (TIGR02118 family)